jgi:hypothetical protein
VQNPREDKQITTSLENGNSSVAGAGGNGATQQGTEGTGSEVERKKGSWLEKYKVPSKPLEELAEGWENTVAQGQLLGFRRNLGIYNLLQPVVRMIQRKKKMQNGPFHQVVSGDGHQDREVEMERIGGDRMREV